MAESALVAFLLWVADKIGGTAISEKFKQRFLTSGPNKTDALLREVSETLDFYKHAQAREQLLLAQVGKLEAEILRLRAENNGLIEENERLQCGRS